MIVMYHMGKSGGSLTDFTYANICIGTNFMAGDCGLSSGYVPTAEDGAAQTLRWSVGITTWKDTHEHHVRQVQREGAAFGWRREVPDDYITIGQ